MLRLYVASMFLLHGLSPVPGVAFGVFVLVASLLLALAAGQMDSWRPRLRLDDRWFGAIFALGLLPLVLAPSVVGPQNMVYAVWWLLTWCLCFWAVREWALFTRIQVLTLARFAALGCVLLASSVIAEFALANTAGLYLSDFFHFSITEFPEATVLGDEMRRPRGFSAEAGFSAIVFECLIPLAVLWLLQERGWKRWGFAAIVAPAYFLLFSAASMTTLVITAIVYLRVNSGWKKSLVIIFPLATVAAMAIATSEGVNWLLYEVVIRKFMEFSPEELLIEAPTFSRPEAYGLAWTILVEQPWGMGWGGLSQAMASGKSLFGIDLRGSGLISFPLEVGASAGWLGMMAYLFIALRKLQRLTRADCLAARAVFFSLLWVSLHHLVVLEFWFPMIWFAMAMADVVVARSAGHSQHAWRDRLATRQRTLIPTKAP